MSPAPSPWATAAPASTWHRTPNSPRPTTRPREPHLGQWRAGSALSRSTDNVDPGQPHRHRHHRHHGRWATRRRHRRWSTRATTRSAGRRPGPATSSRPTAAVGIVADVGDLRRQPDPGQPIGTDVTGTVAAGQRRRRHRPDRRSSATRSAGRRRRRPTSSRPTAGDGDRIRRRPRQRQPRGGQLHRHRRHRHQGPGQRRRRRRTCRCRDNTIGGTAAGAGNIIAYNGGAGVAVVDELQRRRRPAWRSCPTRSTPTRAWGSTWATTASRPNHPGGPTSGPNNYQNYPVLLAAITYNGRTYVKGTLNSAADASLHRPVLLQRHGRSQRATARARPTSARRTVTTDANGNASFQVSFATVVPAGQVISATATDSERRHLRVRRRHPGRRQSSKSIYRRQRSVPHRPQHHAERRRARRAVERPRHQRQAVLVGPRDRPVGWLR